MRTHGCCLRGIAWLLVLAAAGCAGPLHSTTAERRPGDSDQGWLALRDGNDQAAEASFQRALAADPSDARGLFGIANLAYERGDDDTAVRHSLTLLEAAGRAGDPVALALSPAVVSRLSRVLTEIPDRRAAEDRLLALDGSRLPWQARYALGLVLIDAARKRGDASLATKVAVDTGCVRNMTLVGRGGRLPYKDFFDDHSSSEPPRPLVPAACQFQLNTTDGRGGIKILRSEIDLPAGRYQVVLDFGGPARLRVDQGEWHQHGEVESYRPRWSAVAVDLSGGKHTLEIRIGIYGATADVALMVMPASAPPSFGANAAVEPDRVMMGFASALVAGLVGDTNGLLSRIDKADADPRFVLALAAAARLGQADPTRPADITRDKAKRLLSQAVAVDARLARAWADLSSLEMQKSRPREAVAHARRAVDAAPRWWPAHLALATALRGQGFDQPADLALDAGMKLLPDGKGGCALIEAALARAQDREKESTAAQLVDLLSHCDAQSDGPRLWRQKHGDLPGVKAWLEKNLQLSAEPLWVRSELADVLLASGDARRAAEILATLVEAAPRDTSLRIRLADAQVAAGHAEPGKRGLAEAVAQFPGRQDVRHAARLAGLPLPLEAYRLDGRAVIRDFQASARKYEAPAVVVLDRSVEKVLADGGRLVLTHSITQVLSKDAIEHVGEVQIPDGAEVLALRTHKADGTLREAEEIAGKSTISVPNLAVGDFVESETMEYKPPREAVAPGFIGERFYFRSFDAPLDRSEYVLIAPAAAHLEVNARAGAPAAVESQAQDGSRVLTFATQAEPQVFAERSSVAAQEWIPSVRVSSGLSVRDWSRFIADGFVRVSRASPEIRKVAAEIASSVGEDRARLPEAIVSWVRDHVEPENDFAEPATATLARARGNRTALILSLARSMDVPVDLVLARSLLVAKADTAVSADGLDDFREALIRFPGAGGASFVDPQLRRAPFGYLPPALNGAKAIVAGDSSSITTTSQVKDRRSVKLRADLELDGSAKVDVVEELSGWPAVEWTELLDRTGKDREKLRQEFEQRWLGQQFPGAQIDTLSVEATAAGTRRVAYTFKLRGMANRQGRLLQLRPSFFQSQPGRRFGTEPQRKTALMLGFDIPVDLDAEIVLPAGAKVIDLGGSSTITLGGAAFVEERTAVSLPGGKTKLVLHRQSRLPLMRVEPSGYAETAAKLRAVDPVEQAEIRIGLPEK